MTAALSVPVLNPEGKKLGEMAIDPELLGGHVRHQLIKQAIVAYLDHQRQRSARTKRKSDVEGSTRKLFRQKGTGNARMGQVRTPVRRGGGRAFGKRIPTRTVEFPKMMRRMARNSAILSKIRAEEVLVVDGLNVTQPKTKVFASMLTKIGADGGCVFAIHEPNHHLFLSGRNIANTVIRVVDELNTYEVLLRRKLVFTKEAMERLLRNPLVVRGAETAA